MTDERAGLIRRELETLADLVRSTAEAEAAHIAALADRYAGTLRGGGTLYFAGNGGSAADAQHLAAEYAVRFRSQRGALAAIALTTDTSLITAAGNDLGFDEIFARQVEAHCGPEDLLILHSTSGASRNLLRAAEEAESRGVPVVAFLGRGGGALHKLATDALVIVSDETSHIQEMHLAIEHVIAGLVEEAMA